MELQRLVCHKVLEIRLWQKFNFLWWSTRFRWSDSTSTKDIHTTTFTPSSPSTSTWQSLAARKYEVVILHTKLIFSYSRHPAQKSEGEGDGVCETSIHQYREWSSETRKQGQQRQYNICCFKELFSKEMQYSQSGCFYLVRSSQTWESNCIISYSQQQTIQRQWIKQEPFNFKGIIPFWVS